MRQEIRSILSSEKSQDSKLTYSGIASIMDKRIQAARYEQFIISIAEAAQYGFPHFYLLRSYL